MDVVLKNTSILKKKQKSDGNYDNAFQGFGQNMKEVNNNNLRISSNFTVKNGYGKKKELRTWLDDFN